MSTPAPRKSNLPATNAANFMDQSLSSLTPEQLRDLRQEAAKQMVGLEVERKRSVDRYQTSAQEMQDFEDRFKDVSRNRRATDKISMEQTFETASGKATIRGRTGSACFVATAAYGDEWAPEVVAYRRLRDVYLVHSAAGLRFVDWYYAHGPKLAAVVMRRAWMRRGARAGLDGVLRVVRGCGARV